MKYAIDETTEKHSGKGNSKTFIVLHHTGGVASLKNMTSYLAKNKAQVSAHYVIDSSGKVARIGTDDYVLWHAGTGNKIPGYTNTMNKHSIGIEVISNGSNYTKAQIKTLAELVKDIQKRNNIPDSKVIRHKDYSSRKWDIGDNFYKTAGYKSYSAWKKGELGDKSEQLLPEDDTISTEKETQYKNENVILRRRAKETEDLLNEAIKTINPNGN